MKLPSGVRDWLPDELERKHALERTLRGVFARHGYREVQTPGIERIDVLEAGLGATLLGQTFGFYDRQGSLLTLRPEATTPIARLVSTRLRDAQLPLRLSYVQPAFRYEEPQEGRMREFTQAGIERIGSDALEADAESLFCAIEALDASGLGHARFDVNHIAIVESVLAGLDIDGDARVAARRLIADRNVVELRALARELPGANGAARERDLVRFAMARGGSDALAAVRARCADDAGRAAADRLAAVLASAAERGIAARIACDFALVRDFAYYTGIVFEGYVDDVGFALLGGGRYDALLPRFGFDAGAVGWSVSVERLLIALERREARR